MRPAYNPKLQKFQTINLTELNASASYLERIDTKYLLNGTQLSKILDELKKDFKILEIKWKKTFSYDNVYMDSDDYLFYNQHQEWKKTRSKVRTRYYVDSNMAFFEYKQKNKGITSKYRYEFPTEEHGFMTKWKKRFFEWVWQSMYNGEKTPRITPSIKTKYKRITLVSKDSSERLTIDFDIKTQNLRDKNSKEIYLKNLVIIESKSLTKKSISSKLMKNNHYKQSKSCSKYSLWVIYSWLAEKFDTFKDTIEKIKEIRLETINKRVRKITWLKIIQTKNVYKKNKKIKKS